MSNVKARNNQAKRRRIMSWITKEEDMWSDDSMMENYVGKEIENLKKVVQKTGGITMSLKKARVVMQALMWVGVVGTFGLLLFREHITHWVCEEDEEATDGMQLNQIKEDL